MGDYLQLLHYDVGGFYRTHHDQDAHPRSAAGPRLLTVFFYLSNVEAGGGTHFPHLNLTVQPKRGRALIWPSMFDVDPSGTIVTPTVWSNRSMAMSNKRTGQQTATSNRLHRSVPPGLASRRRALANFFTPPAGTAPGPGGSFDWRTIHE